MWKASVRSAADDRTMRVAGRLIGLGWITALAVHLLIFFSVFRQPAAVNFKSSERFVFWPLFVNAVHCAGPGSDFFAVLEAARKTETGANPYNFLVSTGRVPYFFPFRYPVFIAYLMRYTLGRFAPLTAYRLWLLVLEGGLLLFLFAVYRRLRLLPADDWIIRLSPPLLLLFSFPFFLELHMGQFTFVTALLIAAAALNERASLRALSLGLGSLLKLFPLLLFIPEYFRTRRIRLMLSIVSLLVAVNAVFYFRHPDWWTNFYDFNFRLRSGMAGGNFSPLYIFYMLGEDLGLVWSDRAWNLVRNIASLLSVGAALGIVLRNRIQSPLLSYPPVLLGFFVSFYALWEHTVSGVLVIGVLFLLGLTSPGLPQTISEEPVRRRTIRFSLLFLFFLALPSPYILFENNFDPHLLDPTVYWQTWQRYVLVLSKAVPLVGLFGTTLGFLLKYREQ